MFRFLYPHLLWLLLLLPLLAWLKGKRGSAPAIGYSSLAIVKQLGAARRARIGWFLIALQLLAMALLIFSLARPQAGKSITEIDESGIDIALVIDISGSMEAHDLSSQMNRLEVVKTVVSQFIQDRPSDRMGLVAFAGLAYLVSPLTLDHDWLLQRLEQLDVTKKMDGTAIGSGIAAGLNRLKNQKSKSKIMILLTDGVNNAGKISPVTAAEAAKALGVKIYTIGAGTKGEVNMPVNSVLGITIRRHVKVEIDEETLKRVASMTGGKYFRATDENSLRNIYKEIDQLEKTKRTFKKLDLYRELFHWCLIPGLTILLLELLLSNTLFRRLP